MEHSLLSYKAQTFFRPIPAREGQPTPLCSSLSIHAFKNQTETKQSQNKTKDPKKKIFFFSSITKQYFNLQRFS